MGGKTIVWCLSVFYLGIADGFVVVNLTAVNNSVEEQNNEIEFVTLDKQDESRVIDENWYNLYFPGEADGETVCDTTSGGYKYFKSTQSCYKVHTERGSWAVAEMTCIREGGQLAVINSRDEAQVLVRQYPRGFRVVHIGVIQIQYYWKTVDGKTLSEAGYENWGEGKPNNIAGDQYCGSMHPDGSFGDISCSYETAFICEKAPISQPQPASTTETKNNLYTTETADSTSVQQETSTTEKTESVTSTEVYNECDAIYEGVLTRSCLKLHKETASPDEADAICKREHGTLVTIDTYNKAMFVAVLYPDMENINFFVGPTTGWLGMEPIYGSPENPPCFVMYHEKGSGYYKTLSCDYKYPFICEKIIPPTVDAEDRTDSTTNKKEASDMAVKRAETIMDQVHNKCGTEDSEYIYNEITQSCYKAHSERVMWNDAQDTCVREGGHLAIANSQDEADYLMRQSVSRADGISLGFYWKKGNWVTLDGQTLFEAGYDKWHVGEPNNNLGVEFCGYMLRDGTLNDGACEYKNAFICEKSNLGYKSSRRNFDTVETDDVTFHDSKFTSNEANFNCSTSDTGSCYTVHKERVTWDDAEATCVHEGGHLAVINSQDEADILTTLYPDHAGHVYIGFTYHKNDPLKTTDTRFGIRRDGVWLTIDGQTLAEAGYENWTPGEPNNASGKEYCGTLYANGMFDDSDCGNKFAFICEINSNSVQQEQETSTTDRTESVTLAEVYNECDATYEDFNNNGVLTRSCLKLHEETASRDEADAICKRKHGTLVKIDTSEKGRFVKQLHPNTESYNVYLGQTTGWLPRLPLYPTSENPPCVVMHNEGFRTTWSCNNKYSFICENIIPSTANADDAELKDSKDDSTTNKDEAPDTVVWRDTIMDQAYNKCGTEDSGYIYNEITQSCYKAHSERVMWNDAQDTCVREGGHLAIANSQDEADYLMRQSVSRADGISLGFYWKNYNWVTLDGQTLFEAGYDNWHLGEPNNHFGVEFCGYLLRDGTLNDGSCEYKNAFICEKSHLQYKPYRRNFSTMETDNARFHQSKLTSDGANFHCSTSDTGSCYTVHKERVTWDDAEATCVREGGHLAVINSQDEADILTTLYPDHAGHVYIGFKYHKKDSLETTNTRFGIRSDGVWLTIDSQTLAEAGYENWTPREHNSSGKEYCGSLYANGLLDNTDCGNKFAFICEISKF